MVTVWSTDIHMASGISTCMNFAWSLMAVQTTDILMAFDGNMGQGHQYGPQLKQCSRATDPDPCERSQVGLTGAGILMGEGGDPNSIYRQHLRHVRPCLPHSWGGVVYCEPVLRGWM